MKYLILILSLSITILIENGVYNIIYRNLYLNYENNTLQISRSLKEQINSNFRVINSSSHNGTSFYNILHIKTNLDIIVYENSSITAKLPSKKDKNYHEWNIVKKEGKQYLLQNKMRCYIKVRNSKIACENITIEKASIFFFIKIYEEVDYNQNTINMEKVLIMN